MKHRTSSTHKMGTHKTDTTDNRTNKRTCLFVRLCLRWSFICSAVPKYRRYRQIVLQR